jgi:hypothetical protein
LQKKRVFINIFEKIKCPNSWKRFTYENSCSAKISFWIDNVDLFVLNNADYYEESLCSEICRDVDPHIEGLMLGLALRNLTKHHTAKNQYRKLEIIFPEKELRGHSPNFHIHVSESDLNILTIDLPILLQEICRLIL